MTSSPSGVFDLLEKRFEETYGKKLKGFKEKRISSETELRKEGTIYLNLSMIYERISGISKEDKESILSAALQAPSAGCQLLYTILDITDPDKKEKLADLCDHQPFIAKAKMALVFCADCRKWLSFYEEAGLSPRKPGTGDLLLAVEDAVIAAQNAVTAAESLGIGSCYIGDIMERCRDHRRLLNLPDLVFPAAMVVFGRPTRQQQDRPKPRRAPLEQLVHQNGYRAMDGEELRRLLNNEISLCRRLHAQALIPLFQRELDRL